MTHITTTKRLVSGILTALGLTANFSALAATVPAGVALADNQSIAINNGTEVTSLDPHKVDGVPESTIIRNLLEGLVLTDPTGKVIPGVAVSWDNQDFKVWTFHLREDAQWSNGDPVTAQDFVYSWQRLTDPKTASPYSSYLQYAHVENAEDIVNGKKAPDTLGVKAIDDHTLQVTLTEAVPYFPEMLFHTSVKPVNRKTVEQFGDKWTQPENWVGNGAYRLKEWVVNEKIVMARNPHYWDNAHTVIEQATFYGISSEVADVNRYRSGGLDITHYSLPVELFQKLKKELPAELKVYPNLCTYYYEINLRANRDNNKPLTDVRLRAALKLALNRDILVNKVKNQGELEAFGFTPPFTNNFSDVAPAWRGWTQERRNQEAKKLLAEAGYDGQHPLTLTLLYNTSENHKKLALAAASVWQKALGITIKLENKEWKTFLDDRRQGNYQLARAGWCADYNEPSSFLNMMLSNSSNNYAQYQSAEFDRLMSETLKVKTDAERRALYQQAEAVLDKDSALVPVYHYVNARLVKPWVGGFSTQDPMDNVYVKNLYIIKH